MCFARGCLSGVLPGLALLAAAAPVAAAEGWRAAEQHGPTATWTDTPQGHGYVGPTAAVGARGDALLAWERASHTADGRCCLYEMQFVERPPGGAWGPVRDLPGTDGELDIHTDAAVAGNGAAVVGFVTRHEVSGDAKDTRVSVRSPDGAWAAPVTLASGGWPWVPYVAIDDDGRPTAVWQEGSKRVMTSTEDSGAWSAPEVAVAVPPEQYIQRVLLAGDGHGNLVLGLTIYDSRIEYANSGATAAFVATRSARGAWSEPAQLGAWTNGYIQTVATNRRGDAALAWSDGRAAHLVRRPAGAAFGPSEPLPGGQPWNFTPRLALAEDGHLTVATESGTSSPPRVWAEVTSGPIDGAMEAERVGDDERELRSGLVVALREGAAVLLGDGDGPDTDFEFDHVRSFVRPDGGAAFAEVGHPIGFPSAFSPDRTAASDGRGHALAAWTIREPLEGGGYTSSVHSAWYDAAPPTPPSGGGAPQAPAQGGGSPGGSPTPGGGASSGGPVVPVQVADRTRVRFPRALLASRRGVVRLRLRFDRDVVGSLRIGDRRGRRLARRTFVARRGVPVRVRLRVPRWAVRRLRRGPLPVRISLGLTLGSGRQLRLSAPSSLRLAR